MRQWAKSGLQAKIAQACTIYKYLGKYKDVRVTVYTFTGFIIYGKFFINYETFAYSNLDLGRCLHLWQLKANVAMLGGFWS